MKDILFSQVGFWSLFTLLFILAAMAYFIIKMVQLSGDKDKNYKLEETDTES